MVKLEELSKTDLVKKAGSAISSASNMRAKNKQAGEQVGRVLLRKVGMVEGAGESFLLSRYLDEKPSTQKVMHGISFGVKQTAAIALDFLGFEGVAGMLDASASNNTGALSHQAGQSSAAKAREEKAKKEGSGRGGNAAAVAAPAPTQAASLQGAKNDGKRLGGYDDQGTGEFWPDNGLGERPDVAGYEVHTAPSAERRPLFNLAARFPLIRESIRRSLKTSGMETGDEAVNVVLADADRVVGEALEVNPSTGEMLETGALPGLGILSLLRALAAAPAQMTALPAVMAQAPVPTAAGLDDAELLSAATMGVVDPEDLQHIVTSGLDDGLYLNTAGEELDAAGVRRALHRRITSLENETGAIGDGWRAFWDRQKMRKNARNQRKQERIAADRKRQEMRLKAKELNQKTKLARQEQKDQDTLNKAQASYDQQTAQNTAQNNTSTVTIEKETSTAPTESSSSTSSDDLWAEST